MWWGRVEGVESPRKETESFTPNHSLSQGEKEVGRTWQGTSPGFCFWKRRKNSPIKSYYNKSFISRQPAPCLSLVGPRLMSGKQRTGRSRGRRKDVASSSTSRKEGNSSSSGPNSEQQWPHTPRLWEASWGSDENVRKEACTCTTTELCLRGHDRRPPHRKPQPRMRSKVIVSNLLLPYSPVLKDLAQDDTQSYSLIFPELSGHIPGLGVLESMTVPTSDWINP